VIIYEDENLNWYILLIPDWLWAFEKLNRTSYVKQSPYDTSSVKHYALWLHSIFQERASNYFEKKWRPNPIMV
jgi:hypothetical protein